MTTLKDDIALVREAIKMGNLFTVFRRTAAEGYAPFNRVLDAAEKALPKTVKKWTVECDALYDTGRTEHFRHGTKSAWMPYPDRAKAVKFATHMLESKDPIYSNISVIEVEVDDK